MNRGKIWSWIGHYVLPLLVLVVAIYGARRLIASRPEPVRREQPERRTTVRVRMPVVTNYVPRVEAMGQVRPAQQVALRAEVGGRIVSMHPAFEVGGQFAQGVVLAEIEPDDYEAASAQAESHLAQARLQVALELQRQALARDELLQSGQDLPEGAGRRIALREPQVEAARRAVAAAEAALQRARRNVARTRLRAPFDAIVLTKAVDVGSIVSPQALIGNLAGVDLFYLEAALSPGQLRWLPERGPDGLFVAAPPVAVHVRSGQVTFTRTGRMLRLLGDLSGNMARVLVEVASPLQGEQGHDALLLGMYGRCLLPGREISNALLVPAGAVHEGGRIWVADQDDRLQKRQPEIIWSGDEVALIGAGLERDARVIVSALVAAVEGMPLLVEEGNP